jgi:sulfoxide reductase heme-binding subunit YedZ
MPDVQPPGPPAVRRKSGTVKPSTRPLPGWIDWAVLAVAILIAAVSIVYTAQVGAFNVSLTQDALWAWHLSRASGMVAYSMLAASTLWGVFLSSRVIKDWSPGPLSLLLHATTSWLAVIFSVVHAVLLLFDNYYSFAPANLLVPFTGPYRPTWVGFGILGLYLTFVITISFSLRKVIGQPAWQWLHYTSYGAFALISVHALLAGTDAAQPGMRIILGLFGVVVIGLLFMRIGQAMRRNTQRS